MDTLASRRPRLEHMSSHSSSGSPSNRPTINDDIDLSAVLQDTLHALHAFRKKEDDNFHTVLRLAEDNHSNAQREIKAIEDRVYALIQGHLKSNLPKVKQREQQDVPRWRAEKPINDVEMTEPVASTLPTPPRNIGPVSPPRTDRAQPRAEFVTVLPTGSPNRVRPAADVSSRRSTRQREQPDYARQQLPTSDDDGEYIIEETFDTDSLPFTASTLQPESPLAARSDRRATASTLENSKGSSGLNSGSAWKPSTTTTSPESNETLDHDPEVFASESEDDELYGLPARRPSPPSTRRTNGTGGSGMGPFAASQFTQSTPAVAKSPAAQRSSGSAARQLRRRPQVNYDVTAVYTRMFRNDDDDEDDPAAAEMTASQRQAEHVRTAEERSRELTLLERDGQGEPGLGPGGRKRSRPKRDKEPVSPSAKKRGRPRTNEGVGGDGGGGGGDGGNGSPRTVEKKLSIGSPSRLRDMLQKKTRNGVLDGFGFTSSGSSSPEKKLPALEDYYYE